MAQEPYRGCDSCLHSTQIGSIEEITRTIAVERTPSGGFSREMLQKIIKSKYLKINQNSLDKDFDTFNFPIFVFPKPST